jgi:hypothetical protein
MLSGHVYAPGPQLQSSFRRSLWPLAEEQTKNCRYLRGDRWRRLRLGKATVHCVCVCVCVFMYTMVCMSQFYNCTPICKCAHTTLAETWACTIKSSHFVALQINEFICIRNYFHYCYEHLGGQPEDSVMMCTRRKYAHAHESKRTHAYVRTSWAAPNLLWSVSNSFNKPLSIKRRRAACAYTYTPYVIYICRRVIMCLCIWASNAVSHSILGSCMYVNVVCILYIYIYIYTHTHTYTHTYKRIFYTCMKQWYIHTHIHNGHAKMCTSGRSGKKTRSSSFTLASRSSRTASWCWFMCVYVYVRMHEWMDWIIQTWAAHIYMFMYVCVYMCVNVTMGAWMATRKDIHFSYVCAVSACWTVYMCACAWVSAFIPIYSYACPFVSTYVCIHAYIHTNICM